ncbi:MULTISPECIES: DUF5682 family protein [Arthrobacter]|uniref:DUF5682 family protein n=2 Tax=Arthrobacter TaxID=1663 RepID=A0ABU9KGA0_9MICC|nr:DUF5682 family protein [Arthrobacter sp. YJM1]MDP5225927.1 DUF5682 family protein [Arthrobacter sp. YJM1]
MTEVHVLGIRHHGPGSARSVAEALEELRPDAVLVEGPPELDGLLHLLGDPDMVPPVAGLIYAADQPRSASFYPMAAYSPEWIAIRWAISASVRVQAIDLPAAHTLALRAAAEASPSADDGERVGEDADVESAEAYRPDAIAILAGAAGYGDAERWWEDAVEHRGAGPVDRFTALTEAVVEVRSLDERRGDHPDVVENSRREAAMRRIMRGVLREGHRRVVVVCGAYHAPALVPESFPPASADARLLTGLPKVKVAATWVPWTSERLSRSSGYGAGITAPGWYQHLFEHWSAGDPERSVSTTWLVRVAHALRKENLDASTASVIEANRMAEALAALRGRPGPGLAELDEAVQTVLCEGSPLPLDLVRRELTVGRGMGNVPEETPTIPLAADLTAAQRTLRLKATPLEEVLTLDLRKPLQLARSVLLHRLLLLGIGWGVPSDTGRTTGTFKEVWTICWRPELAVAVVEAGRFGTTVAAGAATAVTERARAASSLAELSSLLGNCLLAELPDGISGVMAVLSERSALQQDVPALLNTVEPLARTCRYGNVRGVDVTEVRRILDAVVVRAGVGLATACAGLDDDGARDMRRSIDSAHLGLSLVPDLAPDDWLRALGTVADSELLHGSVTGRATRLLLDAGRVDGDEVRDRLSRRLSVAAPAPHAAAWLDGLLSGDATLLIHDRHLLRIVDEWLAGVDEKTFEDVLPLLRRTFSAFGRPERRELGEQLSHHGGALHAEATTPDLTSARPALQTMARYLGWEEIA